MTVQLDVRPVSLRDANAFIGAHHRHNLPVRGWLLGTSVEVDGERVGVGILGRPVGR